MQALVSKTLDQASAQFAASALITTDQLLAFKSKEEQVLPSGVNGVLSGTGGSPALALEAHSHSKRLHSGWMVPGHARTARSRHNPGGGLASSQRKQEWKKLS